jgi:glycosyltransferase involved in cell wall biosynthesis
MERSRPLHILYLCQYFPPEMGAPAARAYEFSRRWVEAGHRVTVICGIPNHPTGTVYEGYRVRWRTVDRVEGIDVHRMWVYVTANAGMLRRSINYLSFGITAVLGALRLREVDVCIASSPQFFVGLAGVLLRMLRRFPLMLEIRDLWPDSIEAVEAAGEGLLLRVLRRVERFMYRRADRISVVSPAFRDHIEACGVAPERIVTIPNGVSTRLFAAAQEERRSVLAAFEGTFIVAYIGTHGMAHALETAIDAARLLRGESDIHLLFVGEGARKEALRGYARDLDNVTFFDRMPRESVAQLLREIDVALVLLRDTALFRTVIPSKMFEIMGSARPIILGVEGEARRILEEADAGIAIPPENAEALAAAILRLRDDAALRERFGRNAYRYVRENYDLDLLARKYLEQLRF